MHIDIKNMMAKIGFSGEYSSNESNVIVPLSLVSFNEGEVTIIYSPALDISGYGKTESEARNSFKISLEEFVRYTLNKGTFDQELDKLGWKVSKKKTGKKYQQPHFDELLRSKDYLATIVRDKEFRKFNQQVFFPASD
ncbi:MAG: hypothetical protein KAR19_10895 [Bacteroidales bacterium]|nr:hypothetical protein [Bacteroidales bacterium]